MTITDSPHVDVTFNLKPIILIGRLSVTAISKKVGKTLPTTYEVKGINNNYYKQQKMRKTARFKLPTGRYHLLVSYKDKVIKEKIIIQKDITLKKKVVFVLPSDKKKTRIIPPNNKQDNNKDNKNRILSQIYVTAKLGNEQGRNLRADFFLYQNKKIIKKFIARKMPQFKVPPGKYIIKVMYKGVSSQAKAVLKKDEVIEQTFIYERVPDLY